MLKMKRFDESFGHSFCTSLIILTGMTFRAGIVVRLAKLTLQSSSQVQQIIIIVIPSSPSPAYDNLLLLFL